MRHTGADRQLVQQPYFGFLQQTHGRELATSQRDSLLPDSGTEFPPIP